MEPPAMKAAGTILTNMVLPRDHAVVYPRTKSRPCTDWGNAANRRPNFVRTALPLRLLAAARKLSVSYYAPGFGERCRRFLRSNYEFCCARPDPRRRH